MGEEGKNANKQLYVAMYTKWDREYFGNMCLYPVPSLPEPGVCLQLAGAGST